MAKSFSLGYLGISSLVIICPHSFFSVSLLPGLCLCLFASPYRRHPKEVCSCEEPQAGLGGARSHKLQDDKFE